jgi:Alpha/beta hydrolase domain
MRRHLARIVGLALLAGVLTASAEARITRIEIVKVEPAFGGQSFGTAGAFEHVFARAHGELDPSLPANSIIQDLGLAPRNARGMVEYTSDVEMLRPADPATSNRILLFDVINRGNKVVQRLYDADVPPNVTDNNALAAAGDGWLQRQGYTLVWFGWQADVLPGGGRMTLTVPVAANQDGSPLTGTVRSELITLAPTTTLPLSAGWFTGAIHAPYPTVSVDNRTALADGFLPTLTERARETAPRITVANTAWRFGACDDEKPGDRTVCYPAGFKPGRIYELIYRARDPLVLGIGFAVTRDLGAFLKSRVADDAGTPNPVVHGDAVRSVITGSSQSGRMIRTLLLLGLNQAEGGGRAFDAALPHIGGGLLGLNIRFGQPGRGWNEQVDHLYPAYEFPFSYARQTDPLSGRSAGILDRCQANDTCPLIIHAATALEMWEGRQSLGFTDTLGLRDVADPANVRTYVMTSTQHAPTPLPLPTKAPFGACYQQGNPNPHTWTMRALLTALTQWVRDGKEPPPGAAPRIADGTLVSPDAVRFPSIPANAYGGVERPAVRFTGAHNSLHVFDRGAGYRTGDISGVLQVEPPEVGTGRFGALVPQVDADGNDVGGLRSVFVQVPIGTYTGWNQFRDGWFDSGFCPLSGSFVPFATTRAERERTGDARLSLEERYPSKEAYVAAVRKAADTLVAARLLLPEDATRLIAEADAKGIRSGP